MRVAVKPELLRWACTRAGVAPDEMTHRFPQLPAWVSGEVMPTMRQVEDFANATQASVGFFFLPEPPVEQIPIPDYRTIAGGSLCQPTPDLLDTIYLCQQRQEWYRDFARSAGDSPLPFISSLTVNSPIVEAATRIREALGFDLDARRRSPTWIDALRQFIGQTDEAGVLIMVSGVVGGNAHRKLDPDEFRGFALSDGYAPLVFINGSDTKAAQMFTLAHELAHLWLGESALSDVAPTSVPTHRVETWCNRVAAELLVPLDLLRREYRPDVEVRAEAKRLSGRFKVSTLEGRTSFTESFRMLGLKKMATFRELSQSLGVVA